MGYTIPTTAKLRLWFVLAFYIVGIKTPWWLKNSQIVNLMALGIMFTSSGQLIYAGISVFLENEGEAIGRYFLILMLASWVGSIAGDRVFQWFDTKKVLVGTQVIGLIGDYFLIVGIERGDILFMYASATLSSCAVPAVMGAKYLLRQQLGEDHISGTSLQTLLKTVSMAVCMYLAFQAPLIVWAWVLMGIHVINLIMVLYVEPLEKELDPLPTDLPRLFVPKGQATEITRSSRSYSRRISEWTREPAILIAIGEFPYLIGFYCFGKLLPITSVFATPEQAGAVLAQITLMTGLLQFPMSRYADKMRSSNSALISICWFLAMASLCLIWLKGWWVLIAAAMWCVGACSNSLVGHTTYARARNKVLGSNIHEMNWFTAGVTGALFMSLFESDKQYDAALKWLILFVAVSWLASLLLWQLHKLPEKNK